MALYAFASQRIPKLYAMIFCQRNHIFFIFTDIGRNNFVIVSATAANIFAGRYAKQSQPIAG
jgi:hypothetical protein